MRIKPIIQKEFEMLSKMDVKEYTLFRKWEEIISKNWTSAELQRIWEIKHSIWEPKEPNDYLKLEPDVIIVKDKNDSLTWNILRIFTSRMPWNQNVGRILKGIIYDKKTKLYLGTLSLASDFISLKPRDNYIGWTFEQRTKNKMLNFTAMGSSIVPTQPLGFNYVGGKLITLLCCSDKVVNAWNQKYKKEPLVAITTTSLYGGFSQYQNLKYWRKCGTTEGQIPLEPSTRLYYEMRKWVEKKYPQDFRKMTKNDDKVLSRPKGRMLTFAFSKLGIKPPVNNAPRGVYFCRLFENTNNFLSMETMELGSKLFDNKLNVLVNLWKEKYASKRIKNLLKQKRTSFTSLYYDDIINLSWDETKKKYL